MKNQKGITLIALAVTIIVLAILAGVTINMVLGDEGIITQANLEKANQQRESDIEEITMAVSSEDFRRALKGERRSEIQIKSELEKKYGAGNVDIDYVADTGNEMTVKIENNDNRKYSVDSEGRVTVYSEITQTPTPTPTVTPSPTPSTIDVENITIAGTSNEIEIKQTLELTATVEPSNATNKTVAWSSSNTDVATIDSSTGVVTAITEGSTVITAQADGVTATYNINVNLIDIGNRVWLQGRGGATGLGLTSVKHQQWDFPDGAVLYGILSENNSLTKEEVLNTIPNFYYAQTKDAGPIKYQPNVPDDGDSTQTYMYFYFGYTAQSPNLPIPVSTIAAFDMIDVHAQTSGSTVYGTVLE